MGSNTLWYQKDQTQKKTLLKNLMMKLMQEFLKLSYARLGNNESPKGKKMLKMLLVFCMTLLTFKVFAEAVNSDWVVRDYLGDFIILNGKNVSKGTKLYFLDAEHVVEKSDGQTIYVKKNPSVNLELGDHLQEISRQIVKVTDENVMAKYFELPNLSKMKTSFEFIGFGTESYKYKTDLVQIDRVNWTIEKEETSTQTVPLTVSADFSFENGGLKVFPDIKNDGGSLGPYLKFDNVKVGFEIGYYEKNQDINIKVNNNRYAYGETNDSTFEIAPFVNFNFDLANNYRTSLTIQVGYFKINHEEKNIGETNIEAGYFSAGGEIFKKMDEKFSLGAGGNFAVGGGNIEFKDSVYSIEANVKLSGFEIYPILINIIF